MQLDVSIILPTYNRAAFLPQAFASITSQTFQNWQLIVIDDGSTDDTKQVVARFAASSSHSVEYTYQQNRGPAAARNAGLDRVLGRHVAFFDSDDIWLPPYLERSVNALDTNADLDWVFSACRIVEFETGRELARNTFYRNDHPRTFLALDTQHRSEGLNVIVDGRALECQLLDGLSCGPQNSVIRRSFFSRHRFAEQLRVCEDQLLAIYALAEGRRLGYFLDPQVIYHVHDQNSSCSARENSPQKHVEVFGRFVQALDQLRSTLMLTRRQKLALDKRLSYEYFWHLGYNGLWQSGRRREALSMFRRSLWLWPWGISRWKTYLLAVIRASFQRSGPQAECL